MGGWGWVAGSNGNKANLSQLSLAWAELGKNTTASNNSNTNNNNHNNTNNNNQKPHTKTIFQF